ncbi:MAG: DNA-directed RNA polymerase subunit beta' [Microgenomates group bacterium ADurb.Bin219]|nr:MAG: DNA-directed RNA polymerase subunit beta' [Microgenomates group bacterium ADurb.Bin219]
MKGIVDFKSLQIKLASPEEIKGWSHGEVTKPETINYRTLKPEKDGLFCEKIFGPTKDWECYCGKYKRIRYRGIVCDKCGVEVTLSRVRRERMGHINLACPVAHVWYFRGAPSKISLLLDIAPKSLEGVIYFAQYIVTEVNEEERKEAVDKINQYLEEKLIDLEKETEKRLKEAEDTNGDKIKEMKKRVKNPEQVALATEELNLSLRQKIQQIKEEKAEEEEDIKRGFSLLVDKARGLRMMSIISEDDLFRLREAKADHFIKVGMGAESLLEIIKKINLKKMEEELKEQVLKTSGQKHAKASKRLRIVEKMVKAGINPSWMILTALPVIPPDLRPMVQLIGGRFASSDLNDLLRRVINRNNRLKHLVDLGAPEIILRNEKRMLQEAVDALIDSAKAVREKRRVKKIKMRSLSDMLRGKQGRFRQNLLGKRVDYSGRSVIVVGPELRLNQCGLPKEMALEMFKPFVLREMILKGVAPNVRSARNMLERRPPEIFDILEEITKNHPVMLNRAPTLHKLGILSFYPILIEGNAIRIHPCVCSGFNADFDGDQMAVHVPLSSASREEACRLMLPNKNLLRPSDGSPITVPATKEMSLGIYYLTSTPLNLPESKIICADFSEAIFAYQSGKIQLRQKIKVHYHDSLLETTVGRIFFNEVIPESLRFINEPVKQSTVKQLFEKAFKTCSEEELMKMVDSLKDLGFWSGTISGVSLSVKDCELLPEKQAIIEDSNRKVAEIEENFKQGLITQEEKKRLSQEVWLETTEDLAEKTWEKFHEGNPIKIVIEAGVGRISKDTLKQISAIRGLVVDPLGKVVDLPTKSNFREGLSVFEYVTTTRGSRKGLTDMALKTADAGYLTRKLVDVAHDAIIHEEDCLTKEGIEIIKSGPREKAFLKRILGRILAKDLTDPKTKKIIFKKGEEIDEKKLKTIEESAAVSVWVRSPLTCASKFGFCAACYGWDFSTRKMVEIGTPVGVITAQSIGEPGTQLTLKSKHTAGVVGLDVTQGLPRVTELFEVRIPKVLSPLAEISGKVEIHPENFGNRVVVREQKKSGEVREYLVPLTSSLKVSEGEEILAGTQIASGSLDIKEILQIKGLREAQIYLVDEIQKVYESQGIPINDRYFEVIVRKMSEKVRIKNQGATSILPGEIVEEKVFEEENSKIKDPEQKATAQKIILGITQAALKTESWLSAASFQETTSVLSDSALEGKEDALRGLKENVIIGRLIPVSLEAARELTKDVVKSEPEK